MENRDFKGIWIPKEIWLSEDLTLQEKVFLVEINSLDGDNGCYANNEYFSKFFGVSKTRVSEIINSLTKKGYITLQLIPEEGNKRILKTLLKKSLRPSQTFVEDPLKEKFKHNNTVNNTENNTVNNIPDFVEDDRQKTREAKKDTGSTIFSIADLSIQLKQDRATCELFCMTYKISPEQVAAAIDSFANYLIMVGEEYTRSRFRSHFTNWLPKNLDKAKVSSKPLSKNESIDTRYLFGEPA
jgi:hypothetical protein